jgi:hypothetical protein
VVIAAVAGLLPAIYFAAWFKWPAFLAVGVGAVVAVVMVMVIASIGSDPASEDAAWREAAPDLIRLPGSPGPGERIAGQPAGSAAVEDSPSGAQPRAIESPPGAATTPDDR